MTMKRTLLIGLVSILSLALAQGTGGGAMTGGGMSGGSAGAATVQLGESDELGQFLVDAEGMTLYLFLNDSDNISTCYDDCAENWPPLLTEGDATAGEGVDASLLGTTERTDGTVQVTYGGWPLYYYAADAQPGDVNGQGVQDRWWVVSPEGERVTETAESATSYAG